MKRTPAKPSADADRKRRAAAAAEKWRLLQAEQLLSEYRRVKGGRS
ncbi:MAG TPA: hypothetical protein P5318_19545 [Candidatus Hydrogenedentes bacterium]|nr:hypothetical protein [Candidatus Hydrogenedentota bacterium]